MFPLNYNQEREIEEWSASEENELQLFSFILPLFPSSFCLNLFPSSFSSSLHPFFRNNLLSTSSSPSFRWARNNGKKVERMKCALKDETIFFLLSLSLFVSSSCNGNGVGMEILQQERRWTIFISQNIVNFDTKWYRMNCELQSTFIVLMDIEDVLMDIEDVLVDIEDVLAEIEDVLVDIEEIETPSVPFSSYSRFLICSVDYPFGCQSSADEQMIDCLDLESSWMKPFPTFHGSWVRGKENMREREREWKGGWEKKINQGKERKYYFLALTSILGPEIIFSRLLLHNSLCTIFLSCNKGNRMREWQQLRG